MNRGTPVDNNIMFAEEDKSEDATRMDAAVDISQSSIILDNDYNAEISAINDANKTEDAISPLISEATLDSALSDNYSENTESDKTEDATPFDEKKVSALEKRMTKMIDDYSLQNDLAPRPMRFRGIVIICLVSILIIIAGVALGIAYDQISKLRVDVALMKSNSNANIANTDNITKLSASVKALVTSDRDSIIALDIFGEVLQQLGGNLTLLENNALELKRATAASLTDLIEISLENASSYLSALLNLADLTVNVGLASNVYLSQAALIIDVLNGTRYVFQSCAAIEQASSSSPSGYYLIRSLNDNGYVNTYCNMTRPCGGITGGWRIVAQLDISNPNTQCPSNLELITSPRRLCRGRDPNAEKCSEDRFSVNGIEYTEVCGRIIGYQYGNTEGFKNSYQNSSLSDSDLIEGAFVDGVSLTYGKSPRTHIWTFAAAAANNDERDPNSKCACSDPAMSSMATSLPGFVLNNYFCDSVSSANSTPMFYLNDPLWDGEGCETPNTCCTFNNPPQFFRQLSQPSTDDIDMRVCRSESRQNEDILIEIVEIYVK